MIEVMGVLMGIDLQAFARPEGSSDVPPTSPPQSTSSTSASQPTASTSKQPEKPTEKSTPAEPEDVPMEEPGEEDEEAEEEKKRAAEAEVQKKVGNDAYRKRDFATAAEAFQKAWDLWPKDVTFLTNLGGRPLR